MPSSGAPLRKARLLTMAPPKNTKTRVSPQKEKEERDTNKYLQRRLAWCNRTGQQFDEGEEQYSLLPRALAGPDGNPHKGAKSNWTDNATVHLTVHPLHSTTLGSSSCYCGCNVPSQHHSFTST